MTRLREHAAQAQQAVRAFAAFLRSLDTALADSVARQTINYHVVHADPGDGHGAWCIRCPDAAWPCPPVRNAASQAAPETLRTLTDEVMHTHHPAHRGPRVFEQCGGCPTGTTWPCQHWDWAADHTHTQPEEGST